MESKRVCLSSFFTQIRLDDEPYIVKTSLHTTLHLAGIQIAFDALKSLDLPFSPLPSLQAYGRNGIFFIAYAQVCMHGKQIWAVWSYVINAIFRET